MEKDNCECSNATGTILDSFSYVYESKKRIKSVTSNAGTTSYEYDELDQLKKETHADGTTYAYTYDEVGNRLTLTKTPAGGTATTTTYTYDDANQVATVNGTAYTHDANGNLTSDGNKTYVYDNGDRLLAVKDSNGNTIASFTYDSKGMRKTMTTGSETITFHYNEDNNVVYETNSSNQVVASYTWDDNHPVSMTRAGQTYFYQLNGHGDVVALTDAATGTVVNTYDYDAFGNVIKQTETVVNPYTYAGYRFDKETGLYYLQARYYQPKEGRFLTLDPHPGQDNEPLSLNGYSYTDNNPVSRVDHDGAFWISAGKFAGRYIGKGLKYGWKVFKRNYYRMKRPRKKPFVPNSYWSRKASHHSTPGSQHYHNRFYKGRWEKSKVIYDKFGRQRYRVDFSNHRMPKSHSTPHIHEFRYGKGYSPKGREYRYNFFRGR